MVRAIESSNLPQQLRATEFVSYSGVKHGISSTSTLRSAAQGGAGKAAPAPAAPGRLSGCISKVATSIKNFFSGIFNWFLNLCGKGNSSSASTTPAKGSLEAFLAVLDNKDAKSPEQRKAFKKVNKKDLQAVAKEMRAQAKEANEGRKKSKRKPIGDVKAYLKLAAKNPLTEKVREAVEVVIKARTEAAKKAA